MKNIGRGRARWRLHCHWRDKRSGRRWLLRNVNVALFIPGVREVLPHLLTHITEVDKAVGNIDQLGRRVRAKPRDLYPAALVSDSIYGINEVFIS